MEIGSIYEINPNNIIETQPKAALEQLEDIKKYAKANYAFTRTGREALSLILKSIEKEYPNKGKRALLPAYMCDTVFIPFHQNDWEIYFYHVNRNLEAEPDEIEALAIKTDATLILTHCYYGIDTLGNIYEILSELQKKEVIIVEDVTQSYYLKGHNMAEADTKKGIYKNFRWVADYIFGSLRKWYPIPDGGFVASNHILDMQAITKDLYFTKERISYLTSKWIYLYETESLEKKQERKKTYLLNNGRMERWLDETNEIAAISNESVNIILGTNEDCKLKREQNYATLLEGLGVQKKVLPVFNAEHGTNVAALYFPVYLENRESYQKFLQERDIYAPVLWPVGVDNRDILSEEERYIFGHLLALPMDQRYTKKEMEHIIEATRDWVNI